MEASDKTGEVQYILPNGETMAFVVTQTPDVVETQDNKVVFEAIEEDNSNGEKKEKKKIKFMVAKEESIAKVIISYVSLL